jgi:hypothetical protein
MRSDLIRSSHPKKNERIQEKKSITDSISPISTTLAIRDNKNQSEQVRMFLFSIYSPLASHIIIDRLFRMMKCNYNIIGCS